MHLPLKQRAPCAQTAIGTVRPDIDVHLASNMHHAPCYMQGAPEQLYALCTQTAIYALQPSNMHLYSFKHHAPERLHAPRQLMHFHPNRTVYRTVRCIVHQTAIGTVHRTTRCPVHQKAVCTVHQTAICTMHQPLLCTLHQPAICTMHRTAICKV